MINYLGHLATRRVVVEIRDNTVNCNVSNTGTFEYQGRVGQTFTVINTVSIDPTTGFLKMGIVNSTYSDPAIQSQTVNQTTGVVTTTITIPTEDVLDATIDINAGALVRSGLTMMFDPAEATSYSGSGTTLTNIAPVESNNGINATLDNADMYTSGITPYFSITADNVNTTKRIEFDSPTAHLPSGSTLSIFWWSDYDPSGNYSSAMGLHAQNRWVDYMAVGRNAGELIWDTEGETNGVGMPEGNHDYFASTQNIGFNIGDWNEWTSRFDNLTANNFYNGTLDSYSRALSPTSQLTLNRIGATSVGPSERMGNFRVGRWMLYNRALTDNEVRANRLVFESLYGSYS